MGYETYHLSTTIQDPYKITQNKPISSKGYPYDTADARSHYGSRAKDIMGSMYRDEEIQAWEVSTSKIAQRDLTTMQKVPLHMQLWPSEKSRVEAEVEEEAAEHHLNYNSDM